jgi:alkylation response protein AidB-like acyl-CoA dehydrogenase
MNFDFSEDQKLLKEQVARFLSDNCPIEVVRGVLESDDYYSSKVWSGLVDLGLTGTTIPEEYGGLGLGPLELCVIAEELGRASAPVPFSSSVYLATEALKLFGTDQQKEKWLPQLASGEIIATFALTESAIEPNSNNIQCSFSSGKINGVKMPTPDGSYADICIAVIKDKTKDGDGIGMAIVELNNSSVTKKLLSTLDETRNHAELIFNNTDADLMNNSDDGWNDVQQILDIAAVLMAFEQIGGAEASLTMAKEYALDRFAFGRQIGSYQAIKHKLADMYIKIELAKSNSYFGAMMLNDNGSDLKIAAAASRVAATDAFNYAAQENIQTHGGIGFTWEADTQFYYRRSQVLCLALGSIASWKDKLVTQLEEKNIN